MCCRLYSYLGDKTVPIMRLSAVVASLIAINVIPSAAMLFAEVGDCLNGTWVTVRDSECTNKSLCYAPQTQCDRGPDRSCPQDQSMIVKYYEAEVGIATGACGPKSASEVQSPICSSCTGVVACYQLKGFAHFDEYITNKCQGSCSTRFYMYSGSCY